MEPDYERLATSTLDALGEHLAAAETLTDTAIIATALEANTLATLALAEQQARTATALEHRMALAAITARSRGIVLPMEFDEITA